MGTEHLLLGLLHDPAVEPVLGVSLQATRDALDTLDQEALGALGIPAAITAAPLAMRATPARPTLKAVLKDRLPLTPAAKGALQEAGKPMRHGRHITPQQVLLKLLDLRAPDPSAVLLSAMRVDFAAVRARIAASASAA